MEGGKVSRAVVVVLWRAGPGGNEERVVVVQRTSCLSVLPLGEAISQKQVNPLLAC